MKQNAAVEALGKAASGLLYISESEAELEPIAFAEPGELTQDRLLELVGAEPDTAIETESLADFFRTVSKEDKPKFDKLAKVLGEQLSQVKVYKIGAEAEKEVYVVGKTKDGQWAGLKTSVVET